MAVRDGVLAAVVVGIVQLELVSASEVEGSRLLQHVAFTLITGSLALRRTHPVAAAAVLGLGFGWQTLLGDAPVASGFVSLGILIYSVGTYAASRRRAAVGLLAVLAGLAVYPFVADDVVVGDEVVNTLIPVAVWLLARVARERLDRAVRAERARLHQEQDEAQRQAAALAAERRRIARELHDTVAHGVTLMLLQSEVLRDRPDDPAVIDVVQDAGRACLDDLRRLLVVLRDEPATSQGAGTAGLLSLVELARSSGAAVDYQAPPEPPTLPASLDLAVYRVVQEALTNAVKHAAGARVTVTWVVSDAGVEVVVEDDGTGVPLPGGTRGGHGLVGLRERVALHGGLLAVGPREGTSGWRVHAVLPVPAAVPA